MKNIPASQEGFPALVVPSLKAIASLSLASAFLFFTTRCANDEAESIAPDIPNIKVVSEILVGQEPVIIEDVVERIYPHNYADFQEPFDWENLEYLPLPSEYDPVPMPWSDQARRAFNENIRYDYKKADGWELYLNASSPSYRMGFLSFSLYNKYRGIFRYYYFVESGTQNVQDSKVLYHSIRTVGETPLLNLNNQQIVDIDHNSDFSYSIEPQPIADATWYAVEYELAFDRNIYRQNSNLKMLSDFGMKNIQSLSVNNTVLPELNNGIQMYDADQTWSNGINAAYRLHDVDDVQRVANTLTQSDLKHLHDIMRDQNYETVLSGVIHATLANISWSIQPDFHLPTGGVGVLNDSYCVSGADLSSIQGMAPFYNRALGVFYLNHKPTYQAFEHGAEEYAYEYTLNVGSVAYLFNPAVLEIANIENIQQELVATEQESLVSDDYEASLFSGQRLKSSQPLYVQGVRVSFDVMPKNGSEKVHIIKTFRADLVSDK